MSEETEATPADKPAPKRKKSRLLIVVAAVIVLAGGAGGYLFMQRGEASSEPAKPAVSGPAEYFTLDPSVVVNFQDKRAIRFLQVGVSLMSHDPDAIAAAKAAEPRIRNALLLLFSSQDFTTLSTTKGKLALQKEALLKVQTVMKASTGHPGIEAVYFTSFVMQ